MTTNEAAERLREWCLQQTGYHPSHFDDRIDAALAEERRHVIEQIRERVSGSRHWGNWILLRTIRAILDDLSTPEKPK